MSKNSKLHYRWVCFVQVSQKETKGGRRACQQYKMLFFCWSEEGERETERDRDRDRELERDSERNRERERESKRERERVSE